MRACMLRMLTGLFSCVPSNLIESQEKLQNFMEWNFATFRQISSLSHRSSSLCQDLGIGTHQII